jgi:dihydrofolate synthase / folylpolyglutamate synthase
MSSAPQSLQQWLDYQQRTHPRAIDMSLERVRTVAERLGLTPPGCPVATVGGTNGKGSTATLLATLLAAAGRRVGLFSSPHVVRYNERVIIDGVAASDSALVRSFERIEAARSTTTLTFFEYSALAALDLFREAAVEAIVLEVGLGGRLDATNIVDADVAVLCSVGLDHRDWLGDTLDQIGAEKAGIFRRGQAVVLGTADMPHTVWQRLRELDCASYCAGRDFICDIEGDGHAPTLWHYRSERCTLEALPPPALRGAIQYYNAATAITASLLLELTAGCEHEPVARALRDVKLAGRFQIVPGSPQWILDGAHNEPAARVLAAELAARRFAGRTIAVAGMLADKDVAAIARALDAHIDHWVLAGIGDDPRGLSAEALAARLPPLRATQELATDVAAACARARSIARPQDRIVAFGSFHVVGPALCWLGLY